MDRLLGAGVVLFGKTNVPLYLGDWQSFNAIYGTTNNPWDASRSPGGSSGGSAAALAAGLTGLEAGSDIGSSIRNPAHFCGVFGHKPTWGIVPRAGQALPWQGAPVDIDVVGPLARSTDDLALALSAMAGPDAIEAVGWQLRLTPPKQKRLRDFKVALMLDAPGFPVDREAQDRLVALGDFLRGQKVKVDDRARPAIDTAEAWSVYVQLLRSATSDRQSDADFDKNAAIARGLSADDLAIALSAMAGPDAIEAAGWQLRLRPPRQKRLRDFKVALMLDAQEIPVDREVKDRLQALADFLGRQKVKVDDRARPAIDTGEAFRIYVRLLRAATSDRQSDADFDKNVGSARALSPADESYNARALRAAVLPHRDWLAANETRHRMRLAWAEFFTTYDLLLCPVAGTAAFPHDQKGERHERTLTVNGKRVPVTDHLFWAGYTGASYLPSTAAPCGFTPGGLPVGVQIVGPQYGDLTCLAFAQLLERDFQAFVPPSGYA